MTIRKSRKKGVKKWAFCLYVSNHSPKSTAAFANLKKLCARYLRGNCAIEVIDIIKHPDQARAARIVAVPTLVRTWPQPIRTFIGDLSDSERLLCGLDVQH